MTALDPQGIAELPFDEFVRLMGQQVGLDLAGSTPETELKNDLGLDSLAMVEVLLLFAARGVRLPDDLVPEVRTVGDLHHYVNAQADRAGARR